MPTTKDNNQKVAEIYMDHGYQGQRSIISDEQPKETMPSDYKRATYADHANNEEQQPEGDGDICGPLIPEAEEYIFSRAVGNHAIIKRTTTCRRRNMGINSGTYRRAETRSGGSSRTGKWRHELGPTHL